MEPILRDIFGDLSDWKRMFSDWREFGIIPPEGLDYATFSFLSAPEINTYFKALQTARLASKPPVSAAMSAAAKALRAKVKLKPKQPVVEKQKNPKLVEAGRLQQLKSLITRRKNGLNKAYSSGNYKTPDDFLLYLKLFVYE